MKLSLYLLSDKILKASPKTGVIEERNNYPLKFGQMKKSKFIESQIVSILKQAESGSKIADVCREHGISQGTFYKWRSKYSGIEVSQLKRLKELEAELSQYKKVVGEQTVHIRALKDVLGKKF